MRSERSRNAVPVTGKEKFFDDAGLAEYVKLRTSQHHFGFLELPY
jgi:hypothetical protein